MSTNILIPSDIEAIIENKRVAMQEAQRQKEEAERLERESVEAIGRQKYDEYIQESMQKVPEYLRKYVLPTEETPDFYRIGNNWERPSDWLYFQVPGLAKILFAPLRKGDAWKCQYAYESQQTWTGDEYIWSEPSLIFPREYGWNDDLEYTLALARKQLVEYQRFVQEYEADEKERAEENKRNRAERQAEQERKQTERAAADLERQMAEQKQQAEEQTLFDAIKSDPVALSMLKAFVLLRDERSHFESQLEQANDALYFSDERASRQIERLRREADELERRADDERRRLQDDLDDAEAKLKKAARGW